MPLGGQAHASGRQLPRLAQGYESGNRSRPRFSIHRHGEDINLKNRQIRRRVRDSGRCRESRTDSDAGRYGSAVIREEKDEHPATVEQLAAAMAALGMYHGSNTEAEHAKEAARLGGEEAYRMRMANALLGAVQTEAMLADSSDVPLERKEAAWEDQLETAGAGRDNPTQRIGFLHWQILRATTPVRQLAQNHMAGPIPVAAAHAAEGLQLLLGVIFASQDAVANGDVETLAAQAGKLRDARAALENAITNTDILLKMLGSVGL